MAAPTPVKALYTNGKAFVATWKGVWTGTGEFTDSIVANLSDMPYTNRITLLTVDISATAGISALLEFDDASSDVLIYEHPLGNTGNVHLDFTHIDGLQWQSQASGDTGDIVLTTLSAASADAISIVIVGRCS
tara:strand:+ start:563 stop:961 length:399 start_codon:yes stop_codon:yes gene_type:complete